MKIESGLFPHMVLQRQSRGVCDALITGFADHDSAVTVRVTCKGKTVRGFAKKTIGKVKASKLTATLKGLPAGGPYDVELRAGRDTLVVNDVLVGDVWIAAGQSNMQGCGLRAGAAKPHPLVRAFYTNDVWKTAKDPIHNLWHAIDQVHYDFGVVPGVVDKAQGVGPGVAFAQDMHARTGVPQGIIASAHGGTSMSQWDPKLKTPSGSTLYNATIRRAKKNGGKVAGIIWYQGESDSVGDAPEHYTKRMTALVRASRRDLKSPAMPWAIVQIGRVVGAGFSTVGWNDIQNQQRLLPKTIKHLTVVPTIDLALDDAIHISAADQQRLGRRLGYAMDVLLRGSRAGKQPITLRSISVSGCHPNKTFHQVTLQYDNVVGSLHAKSRPTGFTILDADVEPVIYDMQTDGNKVNIRTTLLEASLTGRKIAYAHGTDPTCNIVDDADRSLPVMNAQPIGRPRARTSLATTPRVAMPIELPRGVDGKLNGLKLPTPKKLNSLPWRKQTFAGMCDVHLDIAKQKVHDFAVYYAFDVDAPEAMKLQVCLGYDGPIKLWIAKRELFHDPDGTNPAQEDSAKVKWNAAKGRHRIFVAMGSNMCKAWGVTLRLERLDLTPTVIRRGGYVMPTFPNT